MTTTVTKVRAKLVAGSVRKSEDGTTQISMYGVCSDVPGSENKAFSDASPGVSFSLTIAPGKPAAELFEQGVEYYFDITRATPAAAEDEGV